MSFCFHKDFITIWGMTNISSGLSNFFSYFTLIRYVENTSWKSYKLLQEIGIGFILLIMINILIVSYASKRKDKMTGFSVSIQMLKVLIWFINSLIYLPLF